MLGPGARRAGWLSLAMALGCPSLFWDVWKETLSSPHVGSERAEPGF